MKAHTERKDTIIHDTADIPSFGSEAEEREFWATHELDAELFQAPSESPAAAHERESGPSVSINMRFDRDLLDRVKAYSRERRVGYQTLIKQLVAERLDDIERTAVPDAARGNVGTDRPGWFTAATIGLLQQQIGLLQQQIGLLQQSPGAAGASVTAPLPSPEQTEHTSMSSPQH